MDRSLFVVEPLRAVDNIRVVRGHATLYFDPLAAETMLAVSREGVIGPIRILKGNKPKST